MLRTTILLFLLSIFSLTHGADEFQRIDLYKLNLPDPKSSLFGKIAVNVNFTDCSDRCSQNTLCKVFTYNTAKKECYLSTNDPEILSHGFVQDPTTSIFLKKKSHPNLMYFIFMAFTPPWSSKDGISLKLDSVETCAYYCIRLQERCRSFAFYPINSTCATYNQSILVTGKPSDITELIPLPVTPSIVYFEKQLDSLYYFNPLPGYTIAPEGPLNLAPLDQVKHDACAQKCLADAICKSFSVDGNLNCVMSAQIFGRDTAMDGLTPDSQSVYFSMKIRSDVSHQSIFKSRGEMTSPLFPNMYPVTSRLNAMIISPPGTTLDATLTRFLLRQSEKEKNCIDTLYINNLLYCTQKAPEPVPANKVNGRDQLVVEFRADQNISATPLDIGYSFRVGYEWDWICKAGNNSEEVLSASNFDKLSNPGFPSLGISNKECQWTITAKSGYHVYLSFTKVPKNNVLSIRSKGSSIERNLTDGDFGESVTITYNPDNDPEDTFQFYYLETAVSAKSLYTAPQYQEIKKMNLRNEDIELIVFNRTYLKDPNSQIIDIRYELFITNPKSLTKTAITFIKLGFGHSDWFEECYEGYVDVTIQGSQSEIGEVAPYFRFCGTQEHTKPLLIPAVGEPIIIHARLYQRTVAGGSFILSTEEREGFIIKVETGIPDPMISESTSINSPSSIRRPQNGTGNYTNNQKDIWPIIGVNDIQETARLRIKSAELATIPGKPDVCDNDRLVIQQIYQQNYSTITKRFELCGANSLKTAPNLFFSVVHNLMTVSFLTDDRHNAKGFDIEVDYVTVFPMNESDSLVLITKPGYIISSYYPALIETKTAAYWYVAISPEYRYFNLTFEFATPNERCKQVKFRSKDGKYVERCFTNNETIQFSTNTLVVWTVVAGNPNRLATRVTFIKDHSVGGLSPGAVAGIVIAVILIVSLAALAAAFFILRQRTGIENTSIGRVFFRKDDGTNIVTSTNDPGIENPAATT